MQRIQLQNLPNELFMQAIMPVAYFKAGIIKVEGKRSLGGEYRDVELISPIGLREKISRQELIRNFTYLNGKNIVLGQWAKDRKYAIRKNEPQSLYAMPIPKGLGVQIKDKVATSEKCRMYIVCYADGQGGVDKTYAVCVSKRIFKKLFVIHQPGILEYSAKEVASTIRQSGVAKFLAGDFTPHGLTNTIPSSIFENAGVNMMAGGPAKLHNDTGGRLMELDGGLDLSKVKAAAASMKQKESEREQAKTSSYTLVKSIVNSDGKPWGFEIREDKSGRIKKAPAVLVSQMCERKMITNAKLSRTEAGKPYLSGVGIKLGDLPKEYME